MMAKREGRTPYEPPSCCCSWLQQRYCYCLSVRKRRRAALSRRFVTTALRTMMLATAAEASAGPLNMVPNAPSIMAQAMFSPAALPAAKRVVGIGRGEKTKLCGFSVVLVLHVVLLVFTHYAMKRKLLCELDSCGTQVEGTRAGERPKPLPCWSMLSLLTQLGAA